MSNQSFPSGAIVELKPTVTEECLKDIGIVSFDMLPEPLTVVTATDNNVEVWADDDDREEYPWQLPPSFLQLKASSDDEEIKEFNKILKDHNDSEVTRGEAHANRKIPMEEY